MDSNGDGHLSLEEVKNGLSKSGLDTSSIENIFK